MNYKTKTMKKLFTVIPLVAISLFSFGQDENENLVENGSFESVKGKVRRLGQIEAAEGWTAATGAGADLFVGDSKMPDVMTPENVMGTEDPKDGMNYAGIISFSYGDKEERNYITTKFSSPLKKGERYRVEFYCSLSDLSKYATNKLAAHISKKEPGSDEKLNSLVFEENLILHPKEEVFNGMFGWDKVCGEYIAKGGEKYITIGNFTNTSDVKNERIRKPKDVKGKQVIAAYYYIDEVSVRLLEEDEKCECNYEKAPKQVSQLVFQTAPLITNDMTSAEKVSAQNVYYAYGKSTVTPAGVSSLKAVVAEMKNNPNAKLVITGHTDGAELEASTEEDELKDLGKKRAEFARTLLVSLGVPANQIEIVDAKANVESSLIEEGDPDDLKMAKNRRISFEMVQ